MKWEKDNDEQTADMTFGHLIDAIKSKDVFKIIDLFSRTVQSKVGFEKKADELIEFIQGDIVAYSSADETGVGADVEIQKEKERKEIQSAFSITTTANKYHIAIRECTKNDMDHNNIGVLSIYIIEDGKWVENYVYRGDGKWTPGINIE